MSRLRTRVERSFACQARRTHKQRGRGERKEVAELAARNLSFLAALVRKIVLMRRNSAAHVSLIRDSVIRGNACERLVWLLRIHCSYLIPPLACRSTIRSSVAVVWSTRGSLQIHRSRPPRLHR